MSKSAGNAEAEMAIIVDSIEYKTNRLKETAVGIAQDIFQRDSTKRMVDNLTSMLEIINSLTKSIGGLGTALTGLMAYKGFKGQGMLDIFGTGVGGIKGIKGFFTKPVLTSFATNAGLTMADVDALKAFNQQISQGVTVSRAYEQTMAGSSAAAQSMAVSVANGSVAVEQLSVQSRAAAIGMGLLNAAINVGITLAISLLITQIRKLITVQADAYKTAQDLADQAKQRADTAKAESQQIEELINKYKELKQAETSENRQETRQKALELQEEITNIIASQSAIYDEQSKKIDLVNGSLEEQLEILNKINQTHSDSAVLSAANAYRTARDVSSKYAYDSVGFNKQNVIRVKLKTDNDKASKAIIDNLLSPDVGKSAVGLSDLWGNQQYEIAFSENTSWIKRLKFIDEALEALKTSPEFDASQQGVYDTLLKAREEINQVVGKEIEAAENFATAFIENDAYKKTKDVQTYQDYERVRRELIRDALNDVEIKTAILGGALSRDDITKTIDQYLSSMNGLSDYYDEWVRRNTYAYENMTDAEKAWAAQHQQTISAATFDYEDYKEQIEEVEKSVSTLSSAYQKLDEGTATTSDLGSLFKEFPELAKYSNDVDTLKKKVRELNNQNVTNLIKSFVELKAKISDPEQIAQLNGWINYLLKLADVAEKVNKVTADDYIKYEENNIQGVIDKLEKEKDAQNDILDSLKEQKAELEQIISEYDKTVDAVEKYIDRTQIKPLEQQKSDVEEYYNTQIEKLKEENEERDRNIELQEKQDALANARKTRVRVYSETQGWHYENDAGAIKSAEKDLADLQNSIAIEELEKARDTEVKGIDAQIKSWEKYKDAWKEQVDQITEADEELIASKILGADWHEKIANQDISVMTNFGSEYATYNNRLKNQVEVEIANTEKAIKEREKEINDWKDYKNQLSNLNNAITESNDIYLKKLSQFVLDENSTWEERIEHMKHNMRVIADLNAQANAVDDINPESALAGSGMWGIVKDNNILGLYNTQAEAEANKEKVVKDLVRKQIAPGMPSSVIDEITKRLLESLNIKQYARGGINTQTGLAWLDGTSANNEVIFNSAQAKYLYDIVRNGQFGSLMANNILNGIKANLAGLFGGKQAGAMANTISISFPNAVINAKDYDTFKGFMDKYTNDLLLKMRVGL